MSENEIQRWLDEHQSSIERANRIRAVLPGQLPITSYLSLYPDTVMVDDPELNPLRVIKFAEEKKGLLDVVGTRRGFNGPFEPLDSVELKAAFTVGNVQPSSTWHDNGTNGTSPIEMNPISTRKRNARDDTSRSDTKIYRFMPINSVRSPPSKNMMPMSSPGSMETIRSPSPTGLGYGGQKRSVSPVVSAENGSATPSSSPSNAPPLPPGPPPARKPSAASLLAYDTAFESGGEDDYDETSERRTGPQIDMDGFGKVKASTELQEQLLRSITALVKLSNWPRSVRKVIGAFEGAGIRYGNPFVIPFVNHNPCFGAPNNADRAEESLDLRTVYNRVLTGFHYLTLHHFASDVRLLVKNAQLLYGSSDLASPMRVICDHFHKEVERELEQAYVALSSSSKS